MRGFPSVRLCPQSVVYFRIDSVSGTSSASTGAATSCPKLKLNVGSKHTLPLPSLEAGSPGAGKMVAVTPPEYAGTEVFHTLYLPKDWNPNWRENGELLPIIL